MEEQACDIEDEMAEEASKEAEYEFAGHVSYFYFREVKLFLTYLGDRVFRKSGFHGFWMFKYQINLIDYLNFFEHWNDLLLRSDNGKAVANRAGAEVSKFYDETRRRSQVRAERVWSLFLNLLVVLLSAFVGFVFGRLGFK